MIHLPHVAMQQARGLFKGTSPIKGKIRLSSVGVWAGLDRDWDLKSLKLAWDWMVLSTIVLTRR